MYSWVPTITISPFAGSVISLKAFLIPRKCNPDAILFWILVISVLKPASIPSALDFSVEIAVSKALELGADGISNFEAKVIYTTTYSKYGTTQTLSHYEIKGLCIDRQ